VRMDWLEQHGLTLALFVTLAFHWVRMEVKLAVVVRDMEWVRASLTKWGLTPPEVKRKSAEAS
jgi:hypothetical protein